jgi:uridine phosphorylase
MSTAANLDSAKLQYHIACRAGDVGRYVLLPGDPKRVPLIAKFFDTAEVIAQHREYTTYTGTLDGVKVSVTSTGIGGPSTAIAVVELAKIGADTLIRVGTSGPMQPDVENGDLVVVTGAVRDEGTGLHYMPPAFPAIADLDVVDCLRAACAARNVRYHVGLCHSKDSFYGEIQPERMPLADQLAERWGAWVRGGVLCSEMEAAALFVIASTLGVRAGGLMIALEQSSSVEELCATAVEGLRLLIGRDAEEARRISSAAADRQ